MPTFLNDKGEKMSTRKIVVDDGELVLVNDDEWIHVSKQYNGRGIESNLSQLIMSAGKPSSAYSFFKVKSDTTDEMIKMFAKFYEMGHQQGWLDGQWKLRRDLRDLLGIPHP